MKTVILCGGEGTRLSEETEFKPKPMVEIGGYPILLHVMKHYANYNYKDFVLCLGYKGTMIRDYFANLSWYNDDFTLDLTNSNKALLNKKTSFDYKIIFADTGQNTNTAGRILKILPHITDKYFMVTYSDGLSTININKLIQHHYEQESQHDIVGTITAVHPSSSYGKVMFNEQNIIESFSEKPILKDYINGGFMIFNREKLIPYLKEEEMLEETLEQLTREKKLNCFRHEDFWHSMDTMKDVLTLNQMWSENRPWEINKEQINELDFKVLSK